MASSLRRITFIDKPLWIFGFHAEQPCIPRTRTVKWLEQNKYEWEKPPKEIKMNGASQRRINQRTTAGDQNDIATIDFQRKTRLIYKQKAR